MNCCETKESQNISFHHMDLKGIYDWNPELLCLTIFWHWLPQSQSRQIVILKFVCSWDGKTDCYLDRLWSMGIFSQTYSGPYQTSQIELLAKMLIGLKPVNGFGKVPS